MGHTDRSESSKAAVFARLDAVRAALKDEPAGPLVTQALGQCDRLQMAISQFHAEGLRFAAFTLLRLTQPSGTGLGEPVRKAARDLTSALDEAGYPH